MNKEPRDINSPAREEGESYREIREQTGLGLATIRRIIAEKEKVEV